eukprot:TRINITY_DN8417_c0_g1_i1.p1 TRINITY_DN8417_c0_g1~~TRINITY_DN8417_c0_g1_i1.p1  ORF type:complete len:190 (+),score=42.96 TRINITY_DN8417_c0_g1_i1:168-737(+)
MAFLYNDTAVHSAYRDHKTQYEIDVEDALQTSCTLYIGNLSFYTTEEQIYELFSKCGEVKRIIMGLDKVKKTPCGFCFVEYYTHEDARDAIQFINGTRLDDRNIRTDWDAGFREGRQYGRGKTGGQVRDEYRTDYDPGRGGYGKQASPSVTTTKRDREKSPETPTKKGKPLDEEKNPRFREDKEESDED